MCLHGFDFSVLTASFFKKKLDSGSVGSSTAGIWLLLAVYRVL